MTGGSRTGLAFLACLLSACGNDEAPSRRESPELRTAADSAAADAATLGTEISRLLDLAADYRGSHRGRPPRSLRDLGVDSLTPAIARAVSSVGSGARVTVSYRQARGHHYVSCSGDLSVLESAVLGAGRYTLTCTTPSGRTLPVETLGSTD